MKRRKINKYIFKEWKKQDNSKGVKVFLYCRSILGNMLWGMLKDNFVSWSIFVSLRNVCGILWWYFYCYISQAGGLSLGIDKNSRKREGEKETVRLVSFHTPPYLWASISFMEIPYLVMKQSILGRSKNAQKNLCRKG